MSPCPSSIVLKPNLVLIVQLKTNTNKKSELHNERTRERYGALLVAYLSGCGRRCVRVLGEQVEVIRQFEEVALAVSQSQSQSERKRILNEKLKKIQNTNNNYNNTIIIIITTITITINKLIFSPKV